jgi:protease PrsW
MYVLNMVPAFFIMFVVIALALRREGRIVREFLVVDLNGGLLNQQEYKQVGSVFGRMGASFNAFSKGGFSGWRTCRQFNQAASELAFHRSRVSRGITSHDAHEREADYRMEMQELLSRLRAHHK